LSGVVTLTNGRSELDGCETGMHSRRYQLPPLDLLVAFEAAARHLSFTKAGAELALTQSAVSRQIQAIEAACGARLFERKTRALALTESGRELQRAAEAALTTLDAATRRLKGATALRAVTLTTTPGFAALWLIPRLAAFTGAHPGVDVRISTSYDMINLERAAVDVALRYMRADRAGAAPRLFDEAVIPVCSPALLRDRARPLAAPADLARHTLLHMEMAGAAAAPYEWQLWLRALGLAALKPAATLHFSQYDQLIQAAVAGQGVALGRLPLVRQLLREKRLVAPFTRSVSLPRGYYVLVAPASAAKPEVAAFVDWLLAEARREPGAGEPPPAERSAKRAPTSLPHRRD
jgi:DNA-binding transcriptional LysR family regulator